MKKSATAVLLIAAWTPEALAESIASYPAGWEYWPEIKESVIPPAASELPQKASLFSQETNRTYNWVNKSQGVSITVRIHPDKMNQYLDHGPYTDGPTVIAVAREADIIWVTEHIAGQAIYGSYNLQGQDISHLHPSLNPDTCNSCHTTYKELCPAGVCSDYWDPHIDSP